MSQFEQYGKYYDLFNEKKDYTAEAAYVLELARDHNPSTSRLLEMGCGTGGHAFPLAGLDCSVLGIDVSPEMIDRARLRLAASAQHTDELHFEVGDLRTYRAHATFDAIISLFHVISYQTTDADLLSAFRTARAHVAPGGLFLFDAWYGPAVKADPPYSRTRNYRGDRLTASRTSTPTVYAERNVVHIEFRFEIKDEHGRNHRQVWRGTRDTLPVSR